MTDPTSLSAALPPPLLRELPQEMVGQRVLVRPYRVGDGPALWEAIEESRTHLRPWMPWTDSHTVPADSEMYARRSAARWLLREDLSVGIWERSTGKFVGGSGLHPRDWGVPSFEIGYWIRLSAQGKGYVAETVQILCGLAFDTFGANRVSIQCDTQNIRSANVARRLGFTLEATLRNEARDTAGALRDTYCFGMTPAEHSALRGEYTG